MFDYDTIKHLLTKNKELLTPYHYYYYKFNYELILSLSDIQLQNYIKNHYNIIKEEIVSPLYEFTNEFVKTNVLKIISFINDNNYNMYDNLYNIEIVKWNFICNILSNNSKINNTKINMIQNLFPYNNIEPFTILSYDLLYLSIKKNPKFSLQLLEKLPNSLLRNYYTTTDPIKLCIELEKEYRLSDIGIIYQKILNILKIKKEKEYIKRLDIENKRLKLERLKKGEIIVPRYTPLEGYVMAYRGGYFVMNDPKLLKILNEITEREKVAREKFDKEIEIQAIENLKE